MNKISKYGLIGLGLVGLTTAIVAPSVVSCSRIIPPPYYGGNYGSDGGDTSVAIDSYNVDQWIESVLSVKNTIIEQNKLIQNIKNIFFPVNINDVTSIPFNLAANGVKLNEWKQFLATISNNPCANLVKDNLNALTNNLNQLLNLQLFQYTKYQNALNLSTKQVDKMINDFVGQLNDLTFLIKDSAGATVSNLNSICTAAIYQIWPNNQEILDIFLGNENYKVYKYVLNTIQHLDINIINSFNNSYLPNIYTSGMIVQAKNC